MVYHSVPGGVHGTIFCGNKRGVHEICTGKRTQKYSKDDKERW